MNNLKKILGIFSVLSFICCNLSFASTGIVNTPAARIREKASTDSKVITKAYEDEEVEILEEDGDWYKVKVNGKTGYVSKSLIKTSGSTKSNNTSKSSTNTSSEKNTNTSNSTNKNTNSENKNEATTNTSENNVSTYTTNEAKASESNNVINQDTSLRLLPNFASNELKFLSKDTEVKIEKELNHWVKISLADNSNGWVLKNYVTYEKTDNSEQNPTEETNTDKENNTSTQDTNTAANNTKANTVANTTEESNSSDKNTNTTVESNTSDKNTNTTAKSNSSDNKTNTTSDSNSEVKNIKGKVKVETANVREKPDKSSNIVERLDEDDIVTILEETGDWYKITSSKVSSGYVAKSLIKVISSDVSSRSLTEPREEKAQESVNLSTSGEEAVQQPLVNGVTDIQESTNLSTNGEAVVEYAKQYLGVAYVSGGKTPESGFDCSGFTRYIFKNFGYSLGAVAAEQDSVGTKVERENLKPGDLILFQNEGRTKIGHTGIYIGNNEFIHAANPQRGVVIDNLATNSYYRERFVTARRIVE